MKALLIAPFFSRTGVGEDYSNFKWIEGLSERSDVTVLAIRREVDALEGVDARLVEFESSRLHLALVARSARYERLCRGLKPNYLGFYRQARRWIEEHGQQFDVIHQFSPLALRYPSPATGFARSHGKKLIIGPLAGSLPTPRPLRRYPVLPEARNVVDTLRFRWDPWLRRTYRFADCVIGVAPYVRDRLCRYMDLRRFEIMSEVGVDDERPVPDRSGREGMVVLFVGRLVPPKGVVHAIRAMSLVDAPDVRLRIVGEGPLRDTCEREIERLGLRDRVGLAGRLTKAEVFEEYAEADAFLLPSYREPSGNVVMESMSTGLPIVTTTAGGPGYVVTADCGIRVEPDSPPVFEAGLARAIDSLRSQPDLRRRLGEAARRRVLDLALWPGKVGWMHALYEDVLGS